MAKQTNVSASFLDSPKAKIIALIVIILGLAVFGIVHRDDLFPPPDKKANAGLNPKFVKCRDKRVGDVEKMHAEKVINADQYKSFKTRALEYCGGRFPPRGETRPAASR